MYALRVGLWAAVVAVGLPVAGTWERAGLRWSPPAAGGAPLKRSTADETLIQGIWKITAAEDRGEPQKAGNLAIDTYTFDGTKFSIRTTRQDTTDAGVFRL